MVNASNEIIANTSSKHQNCYKNDKNDGYFKPPSTSETKTKKCEGSSVRLSRFKIPAIVRKRAAITRMMHVRIVTPKLIHPTNYLIVPRPLKERSLRMFPLESLSKLPLSSWLGCLHKVLERNSKPDFKELKLNARLE